MLSRFKSAPIRGGDPMTNLTPRGRQRRKGRERRVPKIGPLETGERRSGDRRRGKDRRAMTFGRWRP